MALRHANREVVAELLDAVNKFDSTQDQMRLEWEALRGRIAAALAALEKVPEADEHGHNQGPLPGRVHYAEGRRWFEPGQGSDEF